MESKLPPLNTLEPYKDPKNDIKIFKKEFNNENL